MSLESAVAAAEALRDELEVEVARSRGERLILRSLDAFKIQARISERLEFVDRADALQGRLRVAQAAAARALGLNDPSAESLAFASPRLGETLLDLIGQIRALASTLSELTTLNQTLADRALGCTRAYVRALAPRPTAYGRLGSAQPAASMAAVSRRA